MTDDIEQRAREIADEAGRICGMPDTLVSPVAYEAARLALEGWKPVAWDVDPERDKLMIREAMRFWGFQDARDDSSVYFVCAKVLEMERSNWKPKDPLQVAAEELWIAMCGCRHDKAAMARIRSGLMGDREIGLLAKGIRRGIEMAKAGDV